MDQKMPATYTEYQALWQDARHSQALVDAFLNQRLSFIPTLLTGQALSLPAGQVLDWLRARYGSAALADALQPGSDVPSPVADQPDGRWIQRANLVGINIRTVGSFWGVVKASLTLPALQNAIHLLPIWEPGVAGSMYGMCSWALNPEFFSPELAAVCPWLDTLESQLKVLVNLLHLQGRVVGMDVIPHTDRFSEMALAFPEYFEWLQRRDLEIVDHSTGLYRRVQQVIFDALCELGPALPGGSIPAECAAFFSPQTPEAQRVRLLFGLPHDYTGRLWRRKQFIDRLYALGYETVPATMAPPFRGLQVDTSPEARVVDADGKVWRDYAITTPQPMSRVFGPLARYHLYEPLDDNRDWQLDFTRPRHAVWEYVCQKYAQFQHTYGFDFMRGDMSHVQMRSAGVPLQPDPYYDLLGAVKRFIQRQDVPHGAPHLAYFAESFLPPRDVMGYGEEIDHLEASHADATLGDLQSTVVGSPEFIQRLRYYLDLLATRLCTPSFTVMTADKDDPRFDHFYLAGNEIRLFLAFFLFDMPSYMALGFESRDPHPQPAPNEHYSKLYVFHETHGPKATRGPFVWGRNAALFSNLTRLKLFAESLYPGCQSWRTRWLIPPDATGASKLIAWTLVGERPGMAFVVNLDPANPIRRFALPALDGQPVWVCAFSTTRPELHGDEPPHWNGLQQVFLGLDAGECRAYRLSYPDQPQDFSKEVK